MICACESSLERPGPLVDYDRLIEAVHRSSSSLAISGRVTKAGMSEVFGVSESECGARRLGCLSSCSPRSTGKELSPLADHSGVV